MEDYWWLTVFPGLAIFLTVLAVNFVGDGLRDALDTRPRLDV
jgi:peptide/nickel transport system permease protein